MKIRITIGGQPFQATLSDSAAARDLISQLPVTIDMVDRSTSSVARTSFPMLW